MDDLKKLGLTFAAIVVAGCSNSKDMAEKETLLVNQTVGSVINMCNGPLRNKIMKAGIDCAKVKQLEHY